MASTVLINARVLDVTTGDYRSGSRVVVTDGRIADVGPNATAEGAETIDVGDRVLMPGLLDAHFHPMIASMHIGSLLDWPMTLLSQYARRALEDALARGFTTVRDPCGSDRGLARAVELGLIRGPRMFVSGRALSQTGGHGDEWPSDIGCPGHHHSPFSRIADGVDEVRKAARDELKRGADHIKIMASGGISSPTDEIWTMQYTEAEMVAAVEEARARRAYVLAHAYTAESVSRAVRAGVRSIEHGNLIDADTAALMAQHRTFLVPTLVAYEKIFELGAELGMPENQRRKVVDVIDAGLDAVNLAADAGVRIGFGTDLLGPAQVHQNREFGIRAKAQESIDVIRSATVVNADLFGIADRVGLVEPGFDADLIVVDGDPLADATVLSHPGTVRLVMRAGEVMAGGL
ncbi:metal-dependent hydrolase family protein [Polymorphospora rubra]|uniref:metal-dependent hydrolase family protein n=1 Tax=Polymorphospora rubra TaxID=338584 RepID=UPI003411C1AA